MLNRIVLVGRTTGEPEMRMTPSGVAVTRFTLAVDRPFKNANGEKETDFIPCIAWRKLGEIVAQYGAKGIMTAVEGRLQIRSYEGQDGQKRKVAEVITDSVKFLERKKDGQPAQQSQGADLDNLDLSDLPF